MDSKGQELDKGSASKELKILNGPSQMDLMFSLFRPPSIEGNAVFFLVKKQGNSADTLNIRVRINSLTKNGIEEWIFEGRGGIEGLTKEKIRGQFDTRTRKGILLILS